MSKKVGNLCVQSRIKLPGQVINAMFNTKFNIFCVNLLTSSMDFGH